MKKAINQSTLTTILNIASILALVLLLFMNFGPSARIGKEEG